MRNSDIKSKAMQVIIKNYKNARDVRKDNLGYDVKIGKKLIEVKGTESSKAPLQRIVLSGKKEYNALKNNRSKYWIYRVIDTRKQNCRVTEIPARDIFPKREARWRVKIMHPEKYY